GRPSVPAQLDAICARAMAAAPQDRYRTMAELADALAELRSASEPAVAPAPAPAMVPSPPPAPPRRRRWAVYGVSLAAVCAAAFLLYLALWKPSGEERPAPASPGGGTGATGAPPVALALAPGLIAEMYRYQFDQFLSARIDPQVNIDSAGEPGARTVPDAALLGPDHAVRWAGYLRVKT